ncbi:DNA-binding protein [Streptomyces camponoticapitis]|uniref:DNA-binding protein n=1 Tax=Streptomyces camponoticapitis TaxID=1616125 RepID=A0ABQ2ESD1_9ACTN|nr:pyridoxamine 5'-phosphate oxidase family protein [Streptomyces camponoticapitis]GGK23444.1 DNA-binding protein [Streptomyces camponoticapitis]
MAQDEQASSDGAAESEPGTSEDVADRMELRRIQLGLSLSELAHSARMSPSYLRELASLHGDFDPEGLARLAEALDMTSDELLHGRVDPPPGQANAGAHPRLMRLTERECWDRLGTHGVGRLGLRGDTAPVIVPVNFLVDGRSVVYRTRPGSVGAVDAGTPLAFEADRLDEERMRGWSVLVTGTTEHLTDSATTGPLADRAGARPWAGGSRPLWIRVLPDEITGRLIDIP